MHRFPSSQPQLNEWKAVCNLDERDVTTCLHICSEHFNESDYGDGLRQRKLKKNAVPVRKKDIEMVLIKEEKPDGKVYPFIAIWM